MTQLCIKEFFEVCNSDELNIPIDLIAGENGLDKQILGPEINRPGLGLAGFFDNFAYSRIQIFGRGESAFVNDQIKKGNADNIRKFFEYDIACCIFTHDAEILPLLIELADSNSVALFKTTMATADFVRRIEVYLGERFAPSTKMQGVLLEVFGVGALVIGESGIGKSECALELIERGHRLIADDTVEIKCISGAFLVGNGSTLIPYHMEIRGLGIINVSMLFGVGAIRDKKRVQLVVKLEEWDRSKEYERTGLDERYFEILGVRVPIVTIPISSVRNVPVIIETAAMNYRLKKLGFNAAREFDKKLRDIMQRRM